MTQSIKLDAKEIKRRVPIETVLKHFGSTPGSNGIHWHCPKPENHKNGDGNPSLTIKSDKVLCWSQKCFGEKAADIFQFIEVMENITDFRRQMSRACEIGGISPINGSSQEVIQKIPDRKIVATYDYTDEVGNSLFQCVRFVPKDFRQRRPDGKGEWIWNLKDTRLVLFNLPGIVKNPSVIIFEGEKDTQAAETMLPEGYTATTSPMGAGKWRAEYSALLSGKDVLICPDTDKPGQQHRDQIGKALQGIAASVRVIKLPPTSKDLAEWIEMGGTAEQFGKMIETAEPWRPSLTTHSSIQEKPQTREWPVLPEEALYGLAGDVVRGILPYTEADSVALLVHFLAEFSAIIGRRESKPWIEIDGCKVPLLFWAVIVGETSKSRKGTAAKRVQQLFQAADSTWTRGKHSGGLSSGEGLIYAVRDPEPDDEENHRKTRDLGIEDKRLFLVQPEFGSILRIMQREGNSLSGQLREAWDGQNLKPMTKGNRIQASDPHIVVCGHITQDELLKNLTDIEISNGLGNRFNWYLVKRSKYLPLPPPIPEDLALNFTERIQQVLAFIQRIFQHDGLSNTVGLDQEARKAWIQIYPQLSEGLPGMAGSLLDRAEAQVRRVAALYALLDEKREVEPVHLMAAVALWNYSVESVQYIYGDLVGDPVSDKILAALEAAGEDGLSDTDISGLFGRNVGASRLEIAKSFLIEQKRIEVRQEETAGRPRRVFVYLTKKHEKTKKE